MSFLSFIRLINTRISNKRFETRDVQNRIIRVKIDEKIEKSENDCPYLKHIFASMNHTNFPLFEFSEHFIFNILDTHQKSSNI